MYKILGDREKDTILQETKNSVLLCFSPLSMIMVKFLHKLAEIMKKYEIKAIKITSANRIALVGFTEEIIE